MTVRKKNENSDFWRGCRQAAEEMKTWPDWKYKQRPVEPLVKPIKPASPVV